MNAPALRKHRIILSAGIATLFAPALHAALDLEKANNTDPLNVGTSWVGGVVPTATDVALWDSVVTGPNTVNLGGDLSFLGIKITNPGGAVTINTGNTLTLGTSGVNMTTATRDFTINSGLALGGAQTWDFGTSGHRLNVGGVVSGGTAGTSILNITGNGTTLLSGANTFSGRATIGNGSLVNLGNNAALGAAGATNDTVRPLTGTVPPHTPALQAAPQAQQIGVRLNHVHVNGVQLLNDGQRAGLIGGR